MLFTVVLCLIILVGGQVSYEGSPKLSEACRPSPSPENLLGCDNNDLRSQAGYYKAAVVEYKPIPVAGRSMTQAVLNNVKEYEKLIEEAGQQVNIFCKKINKKLPFFLVFKIKIFFYCNKKKERGHYCLPRIWTHDDLSAFQDTSPGFTNGPG